MKPGWFVIISLLLSVSRAADIDYLKDVKPLLQERCFSCHGALKQKKSLRLDTVAAMLKGGSDGPVIQRGDPSQSRIIKRVSSTDLEERMPPEHEGLPFTPAQVKLLSKWIAAGAPAPPDEKGEADPKDHWAFRPCVRPPTPVAGANWTRNPIDAFIAKRHAEFGLKAQPEAPREIQLRRLYFDLIGLPPTLEEIAAVQQATSDGWYEETVRRLLDDPRYGERWARHWMDIWRFSDWYGFGDEFRNSQKFMWHWRDWIVESLNADLPYDEMVRLMLAADELHPLDLDKLRATGFLARNYYLFNRNLWMEDTVEHVSKGFLGLTMNCAKCHDHKYDPIRQTDFYQMRAIFEPYHVRMDVLVDEPDLSKDGIPRVFDGELDVPTYRFIRGQETQPDKSVVIGPGAPKFLASEDFSIQPVALPLAAYEPQRRPGIIEGHLRAAKQKLEAAEVVPGKRKALVDKLQKETGSLGAGDPEKQNAKIAVEDARGAFRISEAALAFAKAELASIEVRAQLMRASWVAPDRPEDAEKIAAAIKAEREAQVCKARLTLVQTERRLVKIAEDKKEALLKEIKEAQDAVEKAIEVAKAPVKPEEKFTQLPGAQWTATRFISSTTNDPPIQFPPRSTGRRKALAAWITDRRNPLTARVAVNHIWSRHFGVPLVSTTFDFGRKGTAPTHKELLDWLAVELMENGWNMKRLHRLIVTSATYRMSSSLAGTETNIAKDSDNRYLWRRNPIRLEAEAVRDSMLFLAGTLDLKMGGPPVVPVNQENSKRRSLYFVHTDTDRNLFLMAFDSASVRECYSREQSIVPQQALAVTNSKLALDSAQQIAARFSEIAREDDAFIWRVMLTMLGIEASASEMAACGKALENWRKQDADAARAHLVWAFLNHNDFVTLR